MTVLDIALVILGCSIQTALGLYLMGPFLRLVTDDDLVGGKRALVKQTLWWRLGAFVVFTVFLALAVSSTANAKPRDLTSGEMPQHYQAGGMCDQMPCRCDDYDEDDGDDDA